MTSRETKPTVWIATGQLGDLQNDPEFEIIGVFSSEEAALKAARVRFPHTACATSYELDDIPEWATKPRGRV